MAVGLPRGARRGGRAGVCAFSSRAAAVDGDEAEEREDGGGDGLSFSFLFFVVVVVSVM